MIERGSPGRKLFGLFSYLTKVEVELFTSFMVKIEHEIEQQIYKGGYG